MVKRARYARGKANAIITLILFKRISDQKYILRQSVLRDLTKTRTTLKEQKAIHIRNIQSEIPSSYIEEGNYEIIKFNAFIKFKYYRLRSIKDRNDKLNQIIERYNKLNLNKMLIDIPNDSDIRSALRRFYKIRNIILKHGWAMLLDDF
jgi:hypothetical protein